MHRLKEICTKVISRFIHTKEQQSTLVIDVKQILEHCINMKVQNPIFITPTSRNSALFWFFGSSQHCYSHNNTIARQCNESTIVSSGNLFQARHLYHLRCVCFVWKKTPKIKVTKDDTDSSMYESLKYLISSQVSFCFVLLCFVDAPIIVMKGGYRQFQNSGNMAAAGGKFMLERVGEAPVFTTFLLPRSHSVDLLTH